MKSSWSWRSFIIGATAAAVLVGGVWGGVAIGQAAESQRQAAYLDCLADQGFYPGDPNVDLDQLTDAAAECS